jgi:predicted nucleic acid-binding protein
LLEYLLQTEAAALVGGVLRLPDANVNVPALCDVEIVSGLRRAVLRKLVEVERAELAVQHYLSLPLTRHGHQALLTRTLELRANFTADDACYVALAERLGAGLLTADVALAQAVRRHAHLALLPE